MSSTVNHGYWLGLRINGERYAVPASRVHSVFLSPDPEQSIKDLKISGVVVHDGEPVYLRNHFQLLIAGRGIDMNSWQQVLKRDHAPWIVVLKGGDTNGFGFRVNNIVGPFQGNLENQALFILHNGSNFHLVDVL
jgi:hypothetical protein